MCFNEAVGPASALAAARAKIAKLQRVLGEKTLENEILNEAVEYAAEKKWIARLPLLHDETCEDGLPKLGLARSHVPDLLGRSDDWADGRTHRTPHDDEALLDELRNAIVDLPSYGYRRACALVNRQRAARGDTRAHPKRVYRVMRKPACYCPRRCPGAS